jgi:ATP-dependent DNA ligase
MNTSDPAFARRIASWPRRTLIGQNPDEFVARVAALGLEGVVAKRLDSTCRPGRRSVSWVKHKLRRQERLAVTGVRRSRNGRTEAVYVARRLPDGSVRSAGAIELGLSREMLEVLEQRLGRLPSRGRGAVTWYPAEVSMLASFHGLPDGPVRDGILRGVGS